MMTIIWNSIGAFLEPIPDEISVLLLLALMLYVSRSINKKLIAHDKDTSDLRDEVREGKDAMNEKLSGISVEVAKVATKIEMIITNKDK